VASRHPLLKKRIFRRYKTPTERRIRSSIDPPLSSRWKRGGEKSRARRELRHEGDEIVDARGGTLVVVQHEDVSGPESAR
jgi:hypothetical protein